MKTTTDLNIQSLIMERNEGKKILKGVEFRKNLKQFQ